MHFALTAYKIILEGRSGIRLEFSRVLNRKVKQECLFGLLILPGIHGQFRKAVRAFHRVLILCGFVGLLTIRFWP